MAKVSSIFLVVCAACILELSIGNYYYWQTNPSSQGVIDYRLLSPVSGIWQLGPDCSKSEESEESSSSESNSNESSSSESNKGSEESSKESSSKESKESEESGASKETKESKGSTEEAEGSSSKEEGSSSKGEGSSSKEEGSSSKEGSGSKEGGESKEPGSSESSEEKKKEANKKKKKKSHFPPRSYTFPARKVQRIIYSPIPSYAYTPYRPSYVVQQPVSYPLKSNYQYVSVPSSYPASPVVGKGVNSPVRKIVYSTALNYPVPKSVISPGARVYSVPDSYLSTGYYKK